nr:vesicle-associated membrane protein 7 isoform X2 [Pogona vitticeps]
MEITCSTTSARTGLYTCASLMMTLRASHIALHLPSFFLTMILRNGKGRLISPDHMDFERSRAFTFLNEIKKRFQTTYGSRAQTALPYAMNSEFSSVLAAQLKYHSENKGPDQVAETQAQVDELKGIMVRNIDLVAQRGEKLELLIDKTENLVDSSVTFKTTSRNLARAMCMKNLKLTIIIAIVSIVIIYIIVSAACGGLSWPSCVHK